MSKNKRFWHCLVSLRTRQIVSVAPGPLKERTMTDSRVAANHGSTAIPTASKSVWLDVRAAAARAGCSIPTILRAVRAQRLRSVRINGNRVHRFREEWIDGWLLGRP